MIRKSLRILAITAVCTLSSLTLSSCQSSCSGDPRFDNYWCARGNLSNGVYAQQTSDLRDTAVERQMEAASLRSRLESRQAELAAARANNGSGERIRKLQAEIASLRSQINILRE